MADDQQQQPPMANDKHVLEPQTNGKWILFYAYDQARIIVI